MYELGLSKLWSPLPVGYALSSTIVSGYLGYAGTGMTVFLNNGGSLEAAQDMANYSDPGTTRLYDWRK